MSNENRENRNCEPCRGGVSPMTAEVVRQELVELPGWLLSDDASTISRRFEFKGFAKAVEMANLAAWLGNKQGHHPDISFGWGYCEVAFTTHDSGGVTENDLICAARLSALVA